MWIGKTSQLKPLPAKFTYKKDCLFCTQKYEARGPRTHHKMQRTTEGDTESIV